MSRIGTLSAVDDRTTRNLSQGGFGNMATIVNKISMKIDDDLQRQFATYLQMYDSDKSKVLRTALKEYLDKRMSPMNVKKGIVKTT